MHFGIVTLILQWTLANPNGLGPALVQISENSEIIRGRTTNFDLGVRVSDHEVLD